MGFRPELIDELLKDYKTPEDFHGKNGILKQLSKALLERALAGELTHHLGYEKNGTRQTDNARNGVTNKTLKTDFGDMPLDVPRDRNGEFEPQIIKKGQRRFTGFDDKILSMYSHGMTTRDIQSHLSDIYNVEVSAELVSSVTEEIMSEVREWQNRPLESIYAIAYFDAIIIKARDEGRVINKAVYVAIGVKLDGRKDILGLWIEKEEGAKFWMRVVMEIQARGVKDILIACVDGLKGLPESIESVFPKVKVQVCIVHLVRNSLKYVGYKDRKKVADALKDIYNAPTEEVGLDALDRLANDWNERFPMIASSWKANWSRLRTFWDFPVNIRKVIYTTNTIESLNFQLRKVTKTRASFPSDDAAIKLLYLALKNIVKKWTQPLCDWPIAVNQLSIIFPDRMPLNVMK